MTETVHAPPSSSLARGRWLALGIGTAVALAIFGLFVLPKLRPQPPMDPAKLRAYLGEIQGHLMAVPGGPCYALKPGLDLGDRLKTDSLGLRSAELAKEKRLPRVLVLGDSFAFGFGLREGEPFTARLAERLRGKAEIANAAVSGQQIQDFRAQFERLADAVKPDVVVVTFVINDLDGSPVLDPGGYTRFPTIEEMVDDGFPGTTNLHRLAQVSGLHNEAANAFLMKQVGGEHFLSFGLGPFARARWEHYRSELQKIRDGARARGASTVMFSFAPPSAGMHGPLLKACSELGVPVVTLPQDMDLGEARYRLTWDPHPSAVANERFAERLLGGLVSAGALKVEGVAPIAPLAATPELATAWLADAGGYALTWIHERVAFGKPEECVNLRQAVAGFESTEGDVGAQAVVLLRSQTKPKTLHLVASLAPGAAKRALELRWSGRGEPVVLEIAAKKETFDVPIPDGACEPSVPIAADSLVEVDLSDPAVKAAPRESRRSKIAVRVHSISID